MSRLRERDFNTARNGGGRGLRMDEHRHQQDRDACKRLNKCIYWSTEHCVERRARTEERGRKMFRETGAGGEFIKEPTEFFKWLLSQGLLKDDEATDSLWFVKKSPFFLCLPVKLPVPVSTLQSLQQQNHHFKFVITFETASAWFYTLVDQSRLLIPTEQLIYGTCAFSCCPCRVT